jgi:hypothetical protein
MGKIFSTAVLLSTNCGKPVSSVALRFVDSNKIGMEQASKQAGVSMIMVRVWCPAQKQLSKIHFEKN